MGAEESESEFVTEKMCALYRNQHCTVVDRDLLKVRHETNIEIAKAIRDFRDTLENAMQTVNTNHVTEVRNIRETIQIFLNKAEEETLALIKENKVQSEKFSTWQKEVEQTISANWASMMEWRTKYEETTGNDIKNINKQLQYFWYILIIIGAFVALGRGYDFLSWIIGGI